MKLKSIEILPKGKDGWSSGEIRFSEHITQFFGPNGTGKSPLLQSIIHCFGLNTNFRKDIYEHCAKARLVLSSSDKIVEIERPFSNEFYVNVKENLGHKSFEYDFYSEGDISDYFFKLFNFENRHLISNSKSKTSVYLSTILPFNYVDQNSGYTAIYVTKKKFIKDQLSEMIRFFFNLPEKNSFDKRKSKIKAEKELAHWESIVLDRRSELNIVKDSINEEIKSKTEINDNIERISFELDLAKTNIMDESEIDQSFSVIIEQVSRKIRDIDRELISINQKLKNVDMIIYEIEDEISTLNLNEEARREFLDFGEICSLSGDGCGLFSRSNETYTKNLLYLKDQIKDLKRNKHLDSDRRTFLKESKEALRVELNTIIEKRNEAIEGNKNSKYVLLLNELETKLFEAKSQLSDVLKIEQYEKRYLSALNNKELAQGIVNSFGKENQATTELVKTRVLLTENFVKWLSVIHTNNVSFNIGYVNDFEPVFDGEPVESLSGSTKVRVLLAYHAALVETVLSSGGNMLPFIIFDTPKQHEIDSTHLDDFFKELKILCRKFGIQVVFSTTEYHYIGDKFDIEHVPKYAGLNQNMFLLDPRFNS